MSDTLPTNRKVCTRCIYDERVSAISFDSEGVCNYCHQIDDLIDEYGTGQEKGIKKFERLIDDIKRDGRGKRYDCVIGVSGGTDSSYMIHLARQYGLRPLAVHYDNTWNGAIATLNIARLLQATNVDLQTHVVDNREFDDILRSFFLAGLPELDCATDLGMIETLYRAAEARGIKYIVEGHSFVTEGITPLGKNYFDGRYIREVHRRFGRLPMKTYPLMNLRRFIWETAFSGIKRIRPFWYLDYNKEAARELLERDYGWQYYGGHHLENRIASFCHSIYFPQKFATDYRNNTLAALARNGQLTRREAWERYSTPPHVEEDLENYFCKRLNLSESEYRSVMAAPPSQWQEFPNYKKIFERMRPLFYLLVKTERVPMSFYLKYCFPSEREAA